jgi:hypothetical protein
MVTGRMTTVRPSQRRPNTRALGEYARQREAALVSEPEATQQSPRPLLELTATSGERERRHRQRSLWLGVLVAVAIVGLPITALLWIGYQDHLARRQAAAEAEAQLVAERARRERQQREVALNRERIRDESCERIYRDALARLAAMQRADRVVLQQIADQLRSGVQLGRTGGNWHGLADAHHLLGRVHYYWAYSDLGDEVLITVKKDHAANAQLALREAQRLYQRAGTKTRFTLGLQSWMPERQEAERYRAIVDPTAAELRCDDLTSVLAELDAFSNGIASRYR